MLKNTHYVFLVMVLLVSTGCETLHGASTGFGEDIHNVSNPDKNGWNAIQKADDWMQKNLW